jgi:putative endonuclease
MTNYSKTVLYCGVTNNLELRVHQHKSKVVGSFTARFFVDKLVWYEAHNDINLAIRREKLIKKWRRSWKEDQINEENPSWNDLAKDWDKYLE